MKATYRFGMLVVVAAVVLPSIARASKTDDLVAAIAGDNENARVDARQMLPREGIDAVPKLLPLLKSDNEVVWRTAFNLLADFANQVTAPGREADRAAVTAALMTLVAPDQPEAIKLRGLRLLPIVLPAGYEISPMAKLLDDAALREKARAALVEAGTPEARTALRERLKSADADFQCALLDGLAQLKDDGSAAAIEPLTASDNAKVRAAAMRALAWTGKPSYLKTAKTVLASADAPTRSDALDAMLRLTSAIAENGANREIARDTYLELLKSNDSVQRDAALGALGRVADGSCVAPILAAIKDADNPNRANGIAALRTMQGAEVTREIVAGYPTLSQDLQLALLPVLGAKQDPLASPVLKQAAKSQEASFRMAALAAMGDSGQADSIRPLIAAAKDGSDEEKAVARKSLLSVGDALKDADKKREAAQAYVAALQTAAAAKPRGPAEIADLQRALRGAGACPTTDALEAIKSVASEKALGEPVAGALIAVAKVLASAGQKEKAIDAYKAARDLKPSGAAMTAVIQGLYTLGEKVDLPGVLGVISTWAVVGPFDLGEQNEGWKKHYISEPRIDLTARYMAGKRRLDWKRVVTTDPAGKIDLRANLGETDKAIGYAYAEVTLKEAADAILLIGADDSEKVYVNGQKVHDQFTPRGLMPDQDKIPVKLKAGKNTILLKIWQNSQGWEFCARLTTAGGQPLQFTQGD